MSNGARVIRLDADWGEIERKSDEADRPRMGETNNPLMVGARNRSSVGECEDQADRQAPKMRRSKSTGCEKRARAARVK